MPPSQPERAHATQLQLISTARRLFGERGYADVPAEEIVAAAGLTRGALYHHYADKRALFEAVFEQLESDIADEIAAATLAPAADGDGIAGIAASLDAFLDICQRPEVLRIGLTDAPAVLGWARWREIETEHGLGLIAAQLGDLAAAGQLVEAPIQTLAQIALSAVIEAALIIANAHDQQGARRDAQSALLALLAGMLRL
ncbi:MAG: TetR/AcrR family transcriptional regulator [Actinomycetota bacterium]|nr:TetR/AcrR family transcriptional regulator [Actinomycetota bacterium]